MADIINIISLDLYDPEDFFVPLTIKVSDFRDIGKAKGSFSKTIKIPSTKKNDALLSYSFKITAEGFFDRNKRVVGVIARDGVETFRGSLQLKRVILQDREFVEYEMNLLGNNADWIDSLKGRSIRDLKYANSSRSGNIMVDSWLDNGDNGETLWTLVDYGRLGAFTRSTNVQTTDMFPSAFVKPIMEKIFRNIGYTITGDLFNKDGIRDLIIPFTGKFVKTTPEYDESQRAEVIAAGQFFGVAPSPTRVIFDSPAVSDPSSNYQLTGIGSSRQYTFPNAGNYSATLTGDYSFFQPPLADGTFTVAFFFGAIGSETAKTLLVEVDASNPTGSFSFTTDFQVNKDWVLFETIGQVTVTTGVVLITSNLRLKITANSLGAEDGNPTNLADNLPDIDQIDLINAIIHKGNVKIDTNVLTGEVRMDIDRDFKKPLTDSVDWTEKRDTSREQRIEQIEENLSRELFFKYQDEDDDVNLEEFEETNNIPYGAKKVILDNEFLKGVKEIECPVFAATFMGHSFSGSLYLPIMSDGTGANKLDWTPRLLIYTGLRSGVWKFEDTTRDTYPSAVSVRENSDPSHLSLLFDSIQERDKGLVDRFYGVSINQINNGRLKVTHYYLTEEDIANLDIRAPIFDDGVYYDINEIKDYLDGANESTEVETLQKV